MPIDFAQFISAYIIPLGWKLIGAIAAWVIGGRLIEIFIKTLGLGLNHRRFDATLARYVEGATSVALRVLLVIAILGLLGIETTSFAALLATAGFAIGAAWAGLLSNFTAGVFLVFLHPFKVGDDITAGNATGKVTEIGLFLTTINTPDNVRVYIGNNAVFSSNIVNYSANPYRRVDLTAQFSHDTPPLEAIQRLSEKVVAIPNVMEYPAPDISILTFNEYGVLLAVRPYCAISDFEQVYVDVNKAIIEVRAEAGYKAHERLVATRNI